MVKPYQTWLLWREDAVIPVHYTRTVVASNNSLFAPNNKVTSDPYQLWFLIQFL